MPPGWSIPAGLGHKPSRCFCSSHGCSPEGKQDFALRRQLSQITFISLKGRKLQLMRAARRVWEAPRPEGRHRVQKQREEKWPGETGCSGEPRCALTHSDSMHLQDAKLLCFLLRHFAWGQGCLMARGRDALRPPVAQGTWR